MAGLDLPYSGAVATDIDVFAIRNNLGEGQTDNDTSRVASVVGHGGICHGVHGDNGNGSGTTPPAAVGVWGESDNGFGVYGASSNNAGVVGISADDDGVQGTTDSTAHAGVSGTNNSGGIGVWGRSTGNAGQFDGAVQVNGRHQVNGDSVVMGTLNVIVDIVLAGGDCAEDFDAAEAVSIDPGTVMVLDENSHLEPSMSAYDKRVVGVISGAGDYRPGMILDRQDSPATRIPIALVGKVYCKADASYAAIEVGDLLTTSPTPGHAMKADDPSRSFGTVLGKALSRLDDRRGLIPILVALQ